MAHRDARDVDGIPFLPRMKDPVFLGAHRKPEPLAKAERTRVAMQALLPEPDAELGRALVARAADDLGNGEIAHAVILGGERERTALVRHFLKRAVEGVGDPDEPFLKRPGHRHDLKDGAGIIDVGDGRVAHPRALVGGHLVVMVEIEGRVVAEAQDEPGPRIADDDGGLERLVFFADERELLLDDVLHDEVEGELDVVAVGGGDPTREELREFAAAAVTLAHTPAALAAQVKIIAVLDALGRFLLAVDVADDVGRELVVRIDAMIVTFPAHALDLEFGDFLVGLLGDIGLEHVPADEAATASVGAGIGRRHVVRLAHGRAGRQIENEMPGLRIRGGDRGARRRLFVPKPARRRGRDVRLRNREQPREQRPFHFLPLHERPRIQANREPRAAGREHAAPGVADVAAPRDLGNGCRGLPGLGDGLHQVLAIDDVEPHQLRRDHAKAREAAEREQDDAVVGGVALGHRISGGRISRREWSQRGHRAAGRGWRARPVARRRSRARAPP